MYYNKPMRTRDTMAQVCGVSWCGKNQHCTRFKSTVGLPVPVQTLSTNSVHCTHPSQSRKEDLGMGYCTNILLFG
jgi:hypothetical protein